jgi:hypothetical protein
MDVPTYGSIEPYADGGGATDSGATGANAPLEAQLAKRGSGAVIDCPVGPMDGAPTGRDLSPYASEDRTTA